MKEIDVRLKIVRPTCSTGREFISISVEDEASSVEFLELEVELADFSRILTGLGGIKAKGLVRGLNKIGKTMEHKRISVEMSLDDFYSEDRNVIAFKLCSEAAGPEWTVDNYWGSQSSFKFYKDKVLASTIACRWTQ